MRKLIALITMFLTLTVHANSTVTNQQRLINAFKNYTYEMSVQWDQENEQFAEQKLQQFKTTFKELSANGMTNEEILEVALDQFKNKNLKAEAKELLNVLNTEELTGDEAFDLVFSQLAESQTTGASWTVTQTIALSALVLLSLLIVWASGAFHGNNI